MCSQAHYVCGALKNFWIMQNANPTFEDDYNNKNYTKNEETTNKWTFSIVFAHSVAIWRQDFLLFHHTMAYSLIQFFSLFAACVWILRSMERVHLQLTRCLFSSKIDVKFSAVENLMPMYVEGPTVKCETNKMCEWKCKRMYTCSGKKSNIKS